MKSPLSIFALLLVLCTASFFACKEDPTLVPENSPPPGQFISTLLIENYINRIFIDLLGREALDDELFFWRDRLKADSLKLSTRSELIQLLQTDTSFVLGDSSYKTAYYRRFFETVKGRLVEGAENAIFFQRRALLRNNMFRDSLTGDSAGVAANREGVAKINKVLAIPIKYRDGEIDFEESFRRVLDNSIYDEINMNTFNHINASFDHLYFRFPTTEEFDAAFQMVEANESNMLLGINGQNRGDYLDILTHSREFYAGMVIWMYRILVQRDPEPEEFRILIDSFYLNTDFQWLQEQIMLTDDYANFD